MAATQQKIEDFNTVHNSCIEAIIEGMGPEFVVDGGWNLGTLAASVCKQSNEIDRLKEVIKELVLTVECVLDEKPMPNGEYVHHVFCNGNRKLPPGMPGNSCCCHPGKAQLNKEVIKYNELLLALRQYGKHEFYCRRYSPEAAGYWSGRPAKVEPCTCGLRQYF